MSNIVKLSGADGDFAARVLSHGGQGPTLAVPDDMPPEEVLIAVKSVVSAMNKLDGWSDQLTPVLGALLARVAKDRLWEPKYESLDAYEKAELHNSGRSRATIWKAKKVYESFPSLPLDRFKDIGTEKLLIAAKAVPKDASPKQREKLLDKAAETPSVDEFREYVEQKSGMSSPGATKGAMFQLFGSEEEINELKEHLAEPGFTEFAGDERPIGKILAAVQESKDLWPKDSEKKVSDW